MKHWKIAITILGLLGTTQAAWGITPFSSGPSTMEDDADDFTPRNNDPWNDANLGGTPPGAGERHRGGPPEFLPGNDWSDIRRGSTGLIEEVPSGHQNKLGKRVLAPDGSRHFAIVQFESGSGPYNRANRQITLPGRYWATTDLYIDPSIKPGGDEVPDFWWTNAINNKRGKYLTEGGITAIVNRKQTAWDLYTTSSKFLCSVPVGTWVGLEVEPVERAKDQGIDFVYRVTTADRSQVLGTATTLAGFTMAGDWNKVGGPRYRWYTFAQPNISYLFVDNVGWTNQPRQVVERNQAVETSQSTQFLEPKK